MLDHLILTKNWIFRPVEIVRNSKPPWRMAKRALPPHVIENGSCVVVGVSKTKLILVLEALTLTLRYPLMSALIKLDAVDAWGAPSVLRAPHSSGAVFFASSTSTSRVEKRNIDRAEACFITNDSSYVHEQAHWINDIRGKEEKDKVLKIKIVSGHCLHSLCIRLIPSLCRFYFCFFKVSSAQPSR